ncbi:hypothetical protein [Vulgatibacter incomptus]|uniref:Uncharacterized protein n=1 Tax=Vulgatibacter incomptus TaxID=1391653 RepID=A0A0K1PFM6_9BACT|nr:hypothetical protein [Vulgatibacter incomptus]AKU92211.1 hypothetical protein AKJ08_2598 [Vulgatibacter incomptus]
MAKRNGKTNGRPDGGGAHETSRAPSLARIFEGSDVLGRLLERAGAEVGVEGTVSRFAAAIAEGRQPPEVIPALFAKEPRFGDPGDAMRLYGNLFGVWDLLVAGKDPEEIGRMVRPPPVEASEAEAPRKPRIELPPRGSLEGRELPYEIVEGTWQLLEDLPPRERTRRQDRYANVQSELSEWARLVDGLSGVAQETLEYLCFELAEMFDHAFGDRFGQVRYRALEVAEPEAADRVQAYAADYIAESLDEAEEDEEEGLTEAERRAVERYARQAIVAMTASVRVAQE